MDKSKIKIPAEWGLCMEGNELAFAEAMEEAALSRFRSRGRPFRYLEIGVAEGKTMAAAAALWKEMRDIPGAFWIVGVDIKGGWSLDEGAIKQRFPNAWILDEASAALDDKRPCILLCGSRAFLTAYSGPQFDFVFIDGCHGKRCVKADFIGVSGLVRRGGIVCFHDASEGCQGLHHQPHCGTGIAVREGLKELGLLGDELEGWKVLRETGTVEFPAAHGCLFVIKN